MEKIFSDGYGAFPDPELSDENGLLAVGATLAIDRLVDAYDNGIFPWFNEADPICWYTPPERFVLFPNEIKISKSMRTYMRRPTLKVTHNQAFEAVIRHCAQILRKDQDGTWIHDNMIAAYTELHRLGIAKSIEVWDGAELVGGLYGIEVDTVFCGESMFSKQSNASKAALISLCLLNKYTLIDCQMSTPHLESMGGKRIARADFLKYLSVQKKNSLKMFGY